MADIILSRAYLPDGSATLGRLTGLGLDLRTIELPWRGNQVSRSCIPEGVYTLRKRASGVVDRTTGGDYRQGWEVTGVRDRTYIMIHPGNWARDFEGCIGPGHDFAWHPDYGPMVTHSRKAFGELMTALSGRHEWTIDIRVNAPEYP